MESLRVLFVRVFIGELGSQVFQLSSVLKIKTKREDGADINCLEILESV